MTTYDYFKQQVAQMERIRAQTAHDEHIVEFRAMCAKMINDAIPDIKQQCMEECKQEIEKEQSSSSKRKKEPEIEYRFNFKDIEKQVRKAFQKAFK